KPNRVIPTDLSGPWEPAPPARLNGWNSIKEARHGMVLTQHADDERSVSTHDAGHLLRGAPDREGFAADGRQGVRLRAQEGVPDAPKQTKGQIKRLDQA